MIQRLWLRYRYSIILLKQLVKTDFKLRYQNSVLGYLWTLLRPLFLFAILYVVFVYILNTTTGVPHPGVYLLIGIVVWNYFVEVTTGSVGAIVGKGDMMRKVSFPRYVIVLAGSFAALINLVFNFVIIAIFMAASHTQVSPSIIFLPLLIFELFLFALSIGFLLSALYVKFRDVNFIWEVVIQGAFFAIPIMYGLNLVLKRHHGLLLARILLLNPMAQLIQDMRYMLVSNQTVTISNLFHTGLARLVPLAIVLSIALISIRYFRHRAPHFAEDV